MFKRKKIYNFLKKVNVFVPLFRH